MSSFQAEESYRHDFSIYIINTTQHRTLHIPLGSFKGTNWDLSLYINNESCNWITVSRSDASERVKVRLQFRHVVYSKEYTDYLDEGEKSKRIPLIGICRMTKFSPKLCPVTFIITEKSSTRLLEKSVPPIADTTNQAVDGTCASNTSNISFNTFPAYKPVPSLKISEDLLCLLNNLDSFTDATLKSGTSEIKVHRCILSARSPVFAAMFKNRMQDRLSGTIEIVDMSSDALQAMLKYIYSGKTDHLHEALARNLIYAANKYELVELKTTCIDILLSSMTVSNVLDRLVLGDINDERLKYQAKEFICRCKKFSEIDSKQEWKSLQAERPALAMEVLMSVVEYLQEK